MKTDFWPFSNAKMNVANNSSLKWRWKKWGHLSTFLVSFLSYGLYNVDDGPVLKISTWRQQIST